MLIGLVALIVFGPRKLPELARTLAKTMAEFRRSSDDFKKTWQQELDLEETKKSIEKMTDFRDENTVSRTSLPQENKISDPTVPKIKEISEDDFNVNYKGAEIEKVSEFQTVKSGSEKQDWL